MTTRPKRLTLAALVTLATTLSAAPPRKPAYAVLISANAEWRVVKPLFKSARIETSPYGEYFLTRISGHPVLFFHGGWGKVAAAGSTQYVIDRFHPRKLINLGTCGGVEGRINRFDIVAVERTVNYDIAEAMGDSKEAIAEYATTLPLPPNLPVPAIKATMYSADRDLTPAGLREIEGTYHPIAADWESGAIAWVARRNATPLLILRGVTDLVSPAHAEAQGNLELFQQNTVRVMQTLIADLPKWLAVWP